MRVHEAASTLSPRAFAGPVVTIGVFDGLHLGHQKLIAQLRDWASCLHAKSVVVTFRIHPRAVVADCGPTYITSLPHRLLLLERAGIDAVVLLDFTPRLAAMSAEEFSREYLVRRLGARGLLMGFDSRIGRAGEGTPGRMAALGRRLGFEVRSSRVLKVSGRVVSSTLIRRYIIAGDLRQAGRLLGRPVAVMGTVVKGEGRGRKLGFPTANLDLHHETCPPAGVYAAVAAFRGREMPALVNIGTRPTFHPRARKNTVETHIPGLRGSLYGSTVEIRFLAKVREETRFPDPDSLARTLKDDVEALARLVRGVHGKTT